MFVNPPFQIRRYFSSRGMDEHMFTFGRALYDPHGVVAELQAEARERWEAGPPLLEATWMPRYFAADLLRDLEDVAAHDEASAQLLVVKIVEQLIESHYALNRRWPAKALLLIGFSLLGLQGISEIIKKIAVMRGDMDDPNPFVSAHEQAELEGKALAEEVRS